MSASASTTPAVSPDLSAAAFVGGYVLHSTCSTCTAAGHQAVADANPISPVSATATATAHVVEVVVRNPEGKVPAGTLSVNGLFVADVKPYGAIRPNFSSSGSTPIRGRLSRIEVETLNA